MNFCGRHIISKLRIFKEELVCDFITRKVSNGHDSDKTHKNTCSKSSKIARLAKSKEAKQTPSEEVKYINTEFINLRKKTSRH